MLSGSQTADSAVNIIPESLLEAIQLIQILTENVIIWGIYSDTQEKGNIIYECQANISCENCDPLQAQVNDCHQGTTGSSE